MLYLPFNTDNIIEAVNTILSLKEQYHHDQQGMESEC